MPPPDLPNPSVGGFWHRLGNIFQMIKSNRTWQIVEAQQDTDSVLEHFENDPNNIHDLDEIPNFERMVYNERQARNSWTQRIMDLARMATLETVNNADVLYATDDDVVLDYLIRLMNDTSPAWTLERPIITVGPQDPHPDNAGDAQVVVDPTDIDGEDYPYIRAEEIDFVVTDDTNENGGTLTKYGWPNRTDRQNYKWPGGSGFGVQFPICTSKADGGSGVGAPGSTLLVNGDFELDTGSQFNNWPIMAGVWNTDIAKNSDGVFDSFAEFIGAGNDPRIKQRFITSAGTLATLISRTKYIVGFWYKAGAAGPLGTGTFEVQVKIGAQTFTWSKAISDTDWPTDWTFGSLVVNAPLDIPTAEDDTFAVQIGCQSGDAFGASVIQVAQVCMTAAVEDGNLHFAAFEGTTRAREDDRITVPVASDGVHGGGVKAQWGFYFDMAFGLWEKKIKLPDAAGGAHTVNEAWIT